MDPMGFERCRRHQNFIAIISFASRLPPSHLSKALKAYPDGEHGLTMSKGCVPTSMMR